MRPTIRLRPGQLRETCLLYFTLLIALTACASTAPLQPTADFETGVTALTPAATNTPPFATKSATPESTATKPPQQPVATEVSLSPSTSRLAIIDQSSPVDTSRAGWWSIKTLWPVGQTFKPSFAGLDAIELWTEDQWKATCSGTGATLQVNLREAMIDGPLVGSSFPVVLPDCFKGITFFGFPSLIALTPDQTYAIEVVVTSDDNWGVVWQQAPDSYPRGESIVLGGSGAGDIWFQEGLGSPTPLTEAYCQKSLWQDVRRADGSTFRNQAECTQYANTRQ